MFPLLALVSPVMDILKGTGIIKDKDQELKVQEALGALEVQMQQLQAAQLESVNATMRAEAASEHWLVWSWRPLVGYTFCVTIINNYALLPYFAKYGVQPIVIPGELWSAMLVVLGVAAGTRGLEKWQKAKGP